jgi:hypothetical protein
MSDVIVFFLTLGLIIGFLWLYYKAVSWLTYDLFTNLPEKTGDWVDDYLVVYTKCIFGVILLLPVALLLIFALAAASGKSGSGGGLFSRKSSRSSDDSYGNYVIQYRRHGSWIDGPGSNSESIAESMFDNFVANDPRGENRCRLVYKVNGRVEQVLSTN